MIRDRQQTRRSWLLVPAFIWVLVQSLIAVGAVAPAGAPAGQGSIVICGPEGLVEISLAPDGSPFPGQTAPPHGCELCTGLAQVVLPPSPLPIPAPRSQPDPHPIATAHAVPTARAATDPNPARGPPLPS